VLEQIRIDMYPLAKRFTRHQYQSDKKTSTNGLKENLESAYHPSLRKHGRPDSDPMAVV